MTFVLTAILLPPLFVFGVYHLLTWFDVLQINSRVYWKRVALASAISHVILFTGFIVFLYLDFRTAMRSDVVASSFGGFVFNRSEFWRLLTILDTAPILVILALFSLMDQAGVNPPGLLIVAFGITYLIGTVQWFLVGGGLGAVVEKVWTGLKAGDEEDEEWM